MNWDLICFDLDDTIVDYEQTFKNAVRHCFSIFVGSKLVRFEDWFSLFKKFCDEYWDDYECKRMTREEYRRCRFLDTMASLGLKADEKLADQFHEHFDRVVSKFVVPIHGIIPFLQHLHSISVKLGIVTNGKMKTQSEKIHFLGLNSIFPDDAIIVSETVGIEKPSPEIFEYAYMNLAPNCRHKLFIGDSWEHDVVGALEAEWEAIYFNTRHQPPTTKHIPLAVCKNAGELLWTVFSIKFP